MTPSVPPPPAPQATPQAPPITPLRVLHFVSGGFSGATQVAIELVRASLADPGVQMLLVLRHKRQTPLDKVATLTKQGIPIEQVSGALNLISIWQLAQVCRRFRPDVLVAHGFPEHILGRHAGVWAGVPRLIQVEHNARERYTASRLAQSRWLARRTERIVGVSEGVKKHLLAMGFPPSKVMCIPNGIDLTRFDAAEQHPIASRAADIVMCARFSAQKDHLTAIRAMALLRDRGLSNRLVLAGTGKARHLSQAKALAQSLNLGDQVVFMGQCSDVPALLMSHRIGLLSTHFEGMPLALLESMAAGCAVVASDVVGVREVIDPGRTGCLVPEGDAPALADALAQLIGNTALAQTLGSAARTRALEAHGLPLMRARYHHLMAPGRAHAHPHEH